MALPGALFYQEGSRNIGPWTPWPRNGGTNHFSCLEMMASSITFGYLIAAGTGTITGNLGWTIEVDTRFSQRNPFYAISSPLPLNPAAGAFIPQDRDSDISDLTDMDRLTQAIREIALRTVEKNPGPLPGLPTFCFSLVSAVIT